MIMKRFIIIVLTLLQMLPLAAQTLKVSGSVKDANGEPVIGAVIMQEGNEKSGTVTDVDGRYSINILSSGKHSISVTCIGFKDEVVSVKGKTVVDVVLEEDAELLDEVVVVGYGAMRKSDLTGSLSSLKIDSEEAERSMTFADMLEGGAAGVNILSESTAPDAGISIQIRGMNSYSTSTEPLYVVDGIIINGDSESFDTSISVDTSRGETDVSTNGLSSINPNDIASLEILKDASATAIYGSQGANGVVLITTKSAKSDKPAINFSAGVDVSIRDKRLDVLTFDEYVQYMEMAMPNSTAEKKLNSIFEGYESPENRGTLKVTPIDWQEYILRNAITQRYSFSIMGKPKGYNYMFSLGYKDNVGVVKGTDSKTFNIRLNLDRNFSKTTKLGVKVNGSYTFSNLVNGSNVGGYINAGTSMLRSILTSIPYVGVNPDEELDEIEDEDFQYGPNRWIQNYKNNITKYNIQPSLYFQWGINRWLTFKTTIGGDFKLSDRVDTRTYKITRFGTTACIGRGISTMYNWDTTLSFKKRFGKKHNLSGVAGFSMSSDYKFSQMNHGWYLEQPYSQEHDINSALDEYTYYGYSEVSSSLMSGFVRAVYNYAERYVLTATYRLDGSSRFYGENKWAGFPSFAFAWRPVSEPWFNVPVISNLKIRAGWGQVGNQRLKEYQTGYTYGSNKIGNHEYGGFTFGLYPTNIPNPNLKWETSQQVNVGLDLSLWDGRAALTVDAYVKDTKDLLQQKNISPSSGMSRMWINSGSIRNKGLEIDASFVPVATGGFEWIIGGNISFNRNTITSIGQEGSSGKIFLTKDKESESEVRYFGGNSINSESTEFLNINIEGYPIGLFYGYVIEGILKEGETAPFFEEAVATEGMTRYKDIDGDGKLTTADRTIIGNPHPDFTYGFYTTFAYKGLSFKARFVGSHGADIYNLNNVYDYQTIITKNIRKIVLTEAYSKDNPDGTFPAIGKSKPIENGKMSPRFIEDGSYLNLKSVSLSYRLPINRKKSKVLKGMSVGLSCSNVFMITDYSGWTPKSKSSGATRMGIELNSYPSARTYSCNLKFEF